MVFCNSLIFSFSSGLAERPELGIRYAHQNGGQLCGGIAHWTVLSASLLRSVEYIELKCLLQLSEPNTHTEEEEEEEEEEPRVKVVLTACRPIERELCGKTTGKISFGKERKRERE
jgi:hypothetical protein